MASESSSWADHVRPVLKAAHLDPVRIENSVGLGTPDINYLHGWIELKYVPSWPKRGGPLRIPHFTPQQRVFLRRRWLSGGHAWLLLRVETEYLIFSGEIANTYVGYTNREHLYQVAAGRAIGFDPIVFLPLLTSPRRK